MKLALILLTFICAFFSRGQELEHKHSLYHSLIENKGQWDDPVLFQSKSQKHTIWVQQHGFIYDLRDYSKLQKAHLKPDPNYNSMTYERTVVATEFVGSNSVNKIEKLNKSTAYYNYFIGNDKAKWANDVHG